MASRTAKIKLQTTADTSGAKQTDEAMKNVRFTADEAALAMDRYEKRITAAAVSMRTSNAQAWDAAKSAKNVGQAAGQAGFQIQDFAVQVGGGTSALTAFAQQAPQLLGIFGPGGALAGALVAVGAVAAKVFLDMGKGAEEAGKAAEDMAERLNEAFKTIGGQAAKEAVSIFEHQLDLEKQLADSALELKQAQENRIELDRQQAASMASLTIEALKYLDATGQITDAEQKIEAVRRQAAEAEKTFQVAAVQQKVDAKVQEYQRIAQERNMVQQDVREAENRVLELQKKQTELTAVLNRSRGRDEFRKREGISAEPSAETVALEGEMQMLMQQIEAFQAVIRDTPARLRDLTSASYEAAAAVDLAVVESRKQIEEIETKYQFTQKIETLKTATTAVTAGAQEISKEIEKFQPITAAQEDIKARLLGVLEGGIENQQEQMQVASGLQALMSTLRAGQNLTLQNVQELIKVNNEMASKLDAANREIQSLKVRVNNLTTITR